MSLDRYFDEILLADIINSNRIKLRLQYPISESLESYSAVNICKFEPTFFIFYNIKRKIDDVFRIITYYDIKQNERYNKQSFLLPKSGTNLTFCQNYVFEKIET